MNSFGYGGTNGHVILEAVEDYLGWGRQLHVSKSSNDSQAKNSNRRLFILSHALESGVAEAAANLKRFVTQLDGSHQALDNLAFSLSRRSMLDYRSFVTASTQEELLGGLDRLATGEDRLSGHTTAPAVCFVFTGQGAQWAGMGRELLLTNPTFAKSMKQSEGTLLRLGASWFLIEEICKPEEASRINEAALSQPACTALQIAIVDMLRSWNVLPAGVVGHSSGEIGAAYAAGMLSAEDSLKAAFYRGECVKQLKVLYPNLRGAMLAAGISATDAQAYLLEESGSGKAVIACENSPNSVTISGDETAVSTIQQKLTKKQIFNRKLVVEAAYHSHQMELIEEQYWASIKSLNCGQARNGICMVSAVDGEIVQDGALDARYWCKNLKSRVRFVDAVATLLKVFQGKEIVVVEIGPHSSLAGPIKQTTNALKMQQRVDYLSVLTRNKDASETTITAAGQLFQHGYIGLDLNAINDPYSNIDKHVLSNMPTHKWTHKVRHWSESRRSASYRLRKFPRHDLLGTLGIDSISEEPTWRNYLRLQEQPWLAGHSIGGSIVFPAAGYIAMALEALKQVTLMDEKPWKNMRIRFRQVTFGSALIIPEDSAIETVLSLRQHAVNTSWKEFRVYSFSSNGKSTEHCRGLATAVPQGGRQINLSAADFEQVKEVTEESQTRIDPRKLYQQLRTIGLEYTGIFASHKLIKASPSGTVCYFQIPDAQSTMPSKYQQPHCIHPSTLDLCIQAVFPVMKLAGLLGHCVVVTSIKSLDIHSEIPSKPGYELNTTTNLRQYGRSKVIAKTVLTNKKSRVFMMMDGLVLASSGKGLHSGSSRSPEKESLAHRLGWSIDPDFAEPGAIINRCQISQGEPISNGQNRLCEEYSIILIRRTLASLDLQEQAKIKGHMYKLLQWMKAKCMEINTHATAAEKDLEEQVKFAGAYGECLVHIGPHLARILRGELDALELLHQNDRLYRLYTCDGYDRVHRQLAKYVQILSFKNPNMRILEIGAGTASSTMPILEALSASANCSGRPKLDRYTFTDISTGFFEKAEQKLKKFGDVLEYKRLDIEQSPQQQGIGTGSYDLVIATNVLHATRDIENTLHNVRSLLVPNGHLALTELTVFTLRTGLIFGTLPGWWLSVDGRQEGPLLSVSRWNESLRRCGFSGVDVELVDYGGADHEMSLLISAASREPDPPQPTIPDTLPLPSDAQIVQLVYSSAEEVIADRLIELLGNNNILAKKVALSDLIPDGQLVVVLLEVFDSFLVTCSSNEWKGIRQLCQLATGVLWVTTGAVIECSNPARSLITGLSRSLRSENHSIKFITLDLEIRSELESASDWQGSVAGQICTVFQRSLYSGNSTSLQEWEYAIRSGEILIPRIIEDVGIDKYIRDSVSKYHPQWRAKEPGRALCVNVEAPGLLETLYWADSEKHSRKVGAEEVRVELELISLNFKDVMVAMGQLDGHTALLLEGSGKVIEVGTGLSDHFAIGDSVYVYDFDGLATTSNIHNRRVHLLPSSMSPELHTAVGIAYATAFYGLSHAGNLQEGESILIHSGAGAVGQAAITLAQHFFKASEIFVTVGSDEKRQFIKTKFGIQDANIFSSRELDFYEGILSKTNGNGVDVVLNSLSGEALQKSTELLAPLGRFVEIGKKDVISSEARLEMWSLEENIQFSTVDLPLVGKKRANQLRGIFCTVFDLLAQHKIAMVSPITVRPISELEEAFRVMQTGKHTGKILIRMVSDLIRVSPSNTSLFHGAVHPNPFDIVNSRSIGSAALSSPRDYI